ncbi:MAG TPA: hypothetical protein P5065_01815 [Candidatus Ratteibacteria bacterium]|nr:hypothetical protein [bacterium]HRS05766.1 hypothetical protein [Candidatus Ratteibacteria bacterium]HRV03437.1 hypothetical protein [Candidatus Ratteibacteria bacterium]
MKKKISKQRHKIPKWLKTPEWLTTSETYGFTAVPWHIIKSSKWRFVTHVPHSKEYLMALRSNGLRGFPYMTFYQTWINKQFQGARLSEHTDWIEIDEHGHWKRTGFWESEDAKNMYCTCANTKGYRHSVLKYLEHLLDMGAGGIFLDNLHPGSKCYGPEYGKHKHLYPDQQTAFASLLKEARQMIKKKDPEGALLVNSADPVTLPDVYWQWIDCEMSESYICTWVSTKRWGDWHKQWNGMDKKISKWIKAGKQVCCLSYVGHTTNDIKDDCYFCYASARLMNMIWQAGNLAVYDMPDISILYQIEIGQPLTPEKETNTGIHYRIYKNGIVAVNPEDSPAVLEIIYKFPTSQILDLYEKKQIKVEFNNRTRKIKVKLPPQSGRVYLFDPMPTSYNQPGTTEKETGNLDITIETDPPLGKTQFKVDGIPLWTYSGRWTTKYEMGDNFGRCFINFDKPGIHTIEVIDLEKKSLLVAKSYEEAYKFNEEIEINTMSLEPGESPRLGKLMDPSNPGKFIEGDGYRFIGWSGDINSRDAIIKIKVDKPMKLIAKYEKIK